MFTVQPISSKMSSSDLMCVGLQWVALIFPREMTPPHRKEPASMRSGMVLLNPGCNSGTPWTTRDRVPLPSILAPMLSSKSIRESISGSIAAFSRTLVPLARVAAIRTFTVAPTETMGKRKLPPGKGPSLVASTYPWVTSIFAPRASSPFKWRSTGRGPQAHPPGKETRQRPNRATRGPKT